MVYNQPAYNRAYCRRPVNREKMRVYMRAYRAEKPEYVRLHNERRNRLRAGAKKRGSLVHVRSGGAAVVVERKEIK